MLLTATFIRNAVWRDPLVLWEDVAAKSCNKPRAHDNLGQVYTAFDLVARAREQLRIAIALDPVFPDAHYNLGYSYLQTGDVREARAEFELALRLDPGLTPARQLLQYTYLLDSPR